MKRGFSDRCYIVNLMLTWIFVMICVALTALSGILQITDLTICTVGIPTAFAELGVHTAFIVEKARKENARKYGNTNTEG